MSLHEYQQSRAVERHGFPFYSLVMGAMRQADSDNAERLKGAFPKVWEELQARYSAPGGLLPNEAHAP